MARRRRGGFLSGIFRMAFSLKGIVIMILGAIVVAAIGGPLKKKVDQIGNMAKKKEGTNP